jgi:hypothetical protein
MFFHTGRPIAGRLLARSRLPVRPLERPLTSRTSRMTARHARPATARPHRHPTALSVEPLETRAVPTVIAAPATVSIGEGQSRQVTFRLGKAPTADVTFTLASANAAEVTIDRQSLTFTPANWRTPQAVTVTAVEDLLKDGNKSLKIVTSVAASTDRAYANRAVPDVSVKTIDSKRLPPLNPALYQGAYSGSFTGRLASGPIVATVSGRTISFDVRVNAPAAGLVNEPLSDSAEIADDGSFSFEIEDLQYGLRFSGKLQFGANGSVSATGTWKYGTVASGTWRIDRIAAPA